MYFYLLRSESFTELPNIGGTIAYIKQKFGPVEEGFMSSPEVGKTLLTTHPIPPFFERAFRLERLSD